MNAALSELNDHAVARKDEMLMSCEGVSVELAHTETLTRESLISLRARLLAELAAAEAGAARVLQLQQRQEQQVSE
jgi:hypothetical protein